MGNKLDKPKKEVAGKQEITEMSIQLKVAPKKEMQWKCCKKH